VYNATYANLQTAIYSVDNATTGWVQLPPCNITLTGPIYMTSNVWLRGSGMNTSILFMGNMVNLSMIMSYGFNDVTPTSQVTNIRISDLTLDGNQYKSDHWKYDSHNCDQKMCMNFVYTNHSIIENCLIKDATCRGISWLASDDVTIRNCKFYDIGMNWTGYQDGVWDKHFCEAIWTGGVINCTVTGNYIKNTYAAGIAFEIGWIHSAIISPSSRDWIISHNTVVDSYCGIWVENVERGIISDNVIVNATRQNVYIIEPGENAGINVHTNTRKVIVRDNYINKVGGTTGSNPYIGEGIHLAGENNSADGNIINAVNGNGTHIGGSSQYGTFLSFTNNKISNSSYAGIYYNSDLVSPDISHNKIFGSRYYGMYISSVTTSLRKGNKIGLIHGNEIYSSITTSNTAGIFTRLYNMTITDNTISGYYFGIVSEASNCTINDNHIYGTANIGILVDAVTYSKETQFNSVSGNTIERSGSDGIQIQYNFTVVANNIIVSPAGDGIQIGITAATKARNNTIMGNMIYGAGARGIYELAGADYNRIIDNSCYRCTTTPWIDVSGTNTTAWLVSHLGGMNTPTPS
jgi:parallel beta-helix repeat protein